MKKINLLKKSGILKKSLPIRDQSDIRQYLRKLGVSKAVLDLNTMNLTISKNPKAGRMTLPEMSFVASWKDCLGDSESEDRLKELYIYP